MSNAIANSFALLNEIRQELNQTKSANLRNISKSPSPKKNPLSSLTAPLRQQANINTSNTINPEIPRSSSVHKTSKYPMKPVDMNLERYYPEKADESLQTRKRKLENMESAKIDSYDKGVEVQSSEMIARLKEKIDDEIKSFALSCDEITNKINDLIKNIDSNSLDEQEQRVIDEESDDESDEEEGRKSKKKGTYRNDSKHKSNSNEEKNLFKSLNESFNKIVQNLDNKKFDYLNKKFSS